jgi:hypothetical protein
LPAYCPRLSPYKNKRSEGKDISSQETTTNERFLGLIHLPRQT